MLQTELVIENVDVVKLEASIWTARKKLRVEDLVLAAGSKLPPDELASLGTMRIVDREKLSLFETLKKRAESLCLKAGVRFLGGYAIPVGAMPALIPELDAIQAEFNGHKRQFVESYADSVDDWMARYPDFAPAIARHVDSVESVAARLAFDYVVFGIAQPKAGDGLDRSVASLGGSLFREVAQEANTLLDNSLLGKQSVTRKALNPIRRMRDKLDGLSFLDPRVSPVVETIDGLLASIPKKGEIKGEVFDRVLSLALLLSDADKMRRHGEGLSASRPQDATPDLDLFGPLPAAPEDSLDGDEADGDEDAMPAGTVSVSETAAVSTSEPALATDPPPATVADDSVPRDKAALFAEFDAMLLDGDETPGQANAAPAGEEAIPGPAVPLDGDAVMAAESFVATLAEAAANAVPEPEAGGTQALNEELERLANAAVAEGFFF